jgi:hypothetical protein
MCGIFSLIQELLENISMNLNLKDMVLYDDYNLIIGKQAFDSNGQAED